MLTAELVVALVAALVAALVTALAASLAPELAPELASIVMPAPAADVVLDPTNPAVVSVAELMGAAEELTTA